MQTFLSDRGSLQPVSQESSDGGWEIGKSSFWMFGPYPNTMRAISLAPDPSQLMNWIRV